jgi:hypothetical protein
MFRLHRIVLAVSLAAGLVTGVQAQVSRNATGTSNVTIVAASDDQSSRIVVNHSPFFGMEGSTSATKYSGSAAKISTNLTGNNASVLAVGEPGFEVNVCVSLTSEMVSRDGSGGKLRGGVNLVDSRGSSNRTTAQLSSSGGDMNFFVTAMSPDATSMHNGTYSGALDVIMTYN